MDRLGRWIQIGVVLAVVSLLLAGLATWRAVIAPYFGSALPGPPAGRDSAWKLHVDEEGGYQISYPGTCEPQSSGGGNVMFWCGGKALVALFRGSGVKARKQGLWIRSRPLRDIELDGREGRQYLYTHFDLMSGLRTRSFVVPVPAGCLALEFRLRRASILENLGLRLSGRETLSPEQQRMLASFRWR